MKDSILSSASAVTDPRVAAVFADPLRRRLVLQLAAQPRSIGELAQTMGIQLKRLHYHITALRELGLVVIKARRSRAGRAINVYGACASAFMVPARVSTVEPHAALMAELRKSLDHEHDRQEGMLYYVNAEGEPRMRPLRRKEPPAAVTEHWKVLKLLPADLLNLTTAIEECLNTQPKRKDCSRQSYLIHFAIAPRAGN